METSTCPRCGKNLPGPVNICSACGKHLDTKRVRRSPSGKNEGCLSLVLFGLTGTVFTGSFGWYFLS